ncbi:hypothetical protein PTRA_a1905 [Pseudoalteromonas translucida KMM 520]|uniref:Uncharacterized protein n=1 Tax=Pseudoalteromonas translucida KMM 520 TaxID=1315283 RepID=A0A0U2WDB9_9GAMM|nr:hypothetical protein [Pseudoalteromonas translucida]ALS33047.1 hypothetical protein PTRA_a1905 [Pseudoalteromonas translucida KMM 520]
MTLQQENLQLLISQSKAYFESVLAKEAKLKWEDNRWLFNASQTGFLINRKRENIAYDCINLAYFKGILKQGEYFSSPTILVENEYIVFMKAYIVNLMSKSSNKLSCSTLKTRQLLLKRIYIRMLQNNIPPFATNITSEVIQETVDILVRIRKNQSNAADDYTQMNTVVQWLNHFQITSAPLELKINVTAPPRNTTERVRKDKAKSGVLAEFAECFGDQDDKRNLSIHTFLNIIALRILVRSDSEKIMLNMVLLLIVTGMRFGEVYSLRRDALKKLKVEDPDIIKLLRDRKLPTYYIGIQYYGEKGAGERTHWVEPLAIGIVESIFHDTLAMSCSLREQVIYVRENNFKTLLPKKYDFKCTTSSKLSLINLDDVVRDIYESTSKTALAKGWSSMREYAKAKLKKFDINPIRVEIKGKNKTIHYTLEDIDKYLNLSLQADSTISSDFIFRMIDHRNNINYEVKYEDMLFIVPLGSNKLSKTGYTKPIPQLVSINNMMSFLGSGNTNSSNSIFSKYKLIDELGQTTYLNTHFPRHAINTFFAIAGVADHLQAMFMGRTDIRQNAYYQHLAIQEKARSNQLITHSKPSSCSQNSSVTKSSGSLNNALQKVKDTSQISLTTKLQPNNAFNQTLHTYTTKQDRTDFIEDIIDKTSSDIFSEFEDMDVTDVVKKDIISTHSDLYPLYIGSCMRKLTTFECPYNTKCQDGSYCPYFIITGREDEFDKMTALISEIHEQITVLNQLIISKYIEENTAIELIEELKGRLSNLDYQLSQSSILESEKSKVNLASFDVFKKPKMLSELFAVEQRKLKT